MSKNPLILPLPFVKFDENITPKELSIKIECSIMIHEEVG